MTTTTNFSHVINDTLRDVLEGRIAPMTATLGACIDLTFSCLQEDMRSDLLPPAVIDARHDAFDTAAAAHQGGDNQDALDALRIYWSV